MLSLPVIGENSASREQASVLFLRNRRLDLSRVGALTSRTRPGTDDGCQVSCTDWHDNARPIVASERVFALPGYEPLEGRSDRQRPRERHRTDVPPQPTTAR